MPKPTSSQSAQPSKVASFRLDEMSAGGLPDDFDGTASKIRLVPWNYSGNRQEYSLAVRVDITPDEESGLDPFSQYYSAGDLHHFVPSLDGDTPAGGSADDYLALADGQADISADEEADYEGVYALAIGNKVQLNNGSNWASFLQAAIDADKAVADLIGTDISTLEGLYGHWNRIPQKKRSGLRDQDDSKQKTILVLTEIKPAPKSVAKGKSAGATTAAAGKASSAKSTSKPATPATSESDDDFTERFDAAIISLLSDADNNTLTKGKLAAAMMKAFTDKSEKARAVKMAGDVPYLSDDSRPWTYDGDTGTLSLE